MTVLSLPVYWFLSHHWQHEGLATASSICFISYTAVIFCPLVRRTKNAEASGLVRFFAKIVAICAVSSLACQRLAQWLQPRMAWQNSLGALELIVPVCLVVLLLVVLLAISHRGIRKSLPEALDLAARAHSDVGGLNLRFYRLHKNETLDHL